MRDKWEDVLEMWAHAEVLTGPWADPVKCLPQQFSTLWTGIKTGCFLLIFLTSKSSLAVPNNIFFLLPITKCAGSKVNQREKLTAHKHLVCQRQGRSCGRSGAPLDLPRGGCSKSPKCPDFIWFICRQEGSYLPQGREFHSGMMQSCESQDILGSPWWPRCLQPPMGPLAEMNPSGWGSCQHWIHLCRHRNAALPKGLLLSLIWHPALGARGALGSSWECHWESSGIMQWG